jgi:hypothetical protein
LNPWCALIDGAGFTFGTLFTLAATVLAGVLITLVVLMTAVLALNAFLGSSKHYKKMDNALSKLRHDLEPT